MSKFAHLAASRRRKHEYFFHFFLFTESYRTIVIVTASSNTQTNSITFLAAKLVMTKSISRDTRTNRYSKALNDQQNDIIIFTFLRSNLFL